MPLLNYFYTVIYNLLGYVCLNCLHTTFLYFGPTLIYIAIYVLYFVQDGTKVVIVPSAPRICTHVLYNNIWAMIWFYNSVWPITII